MPSRRSNLLLIFLPSLSILLLAIFLALFFGTQSQENIPKPHQRFVLKTPPMEEKQTTRKFWNDQPNLAPQLGYFLRSPEEVLSETIANPRSNDILWEEVQEDLVLMIKEKFPELKLSKRQLLELTETIKIIRKAMNEMREFERTRDNSDAVRRIRGELDWAVDSFGQITQMDLAEFILRGRPKSGIDNEEPEDGEIVKEYLSDLKP